MLELFWSCLPNSPAILAQPRVWCHPPCNWHQPNPLPEYVDPLNAKGRVRGRCLNYFGLAYPNPLLFLPTLEFDFTLPLMTSTKFWSYSPIPLLFSPNQIFDVTRPMIVINNWSGHVCPFYCYSCPIKNYILPVCVVMLTLLHFWLPFQTSSFTHGQGWC